jgi:hypothetical protein
LSRPKGDPKKGANVFVDLKYLYEDGTVGMEKVDTVRKIKDDQVLITINLKSLPPGSTDARLYTRGDNTTDQIRLLDKGTEDVEIYYYKRDQLVRTDYPKRVGLHYNEQKDIWVINQDVRSTNFDVLKKALLANKKLITALKLDLPKLQKMKESKTPADLQRAMGVDDAQFGKLYRDVFTPNEQEESQTLKVMSKYQPKK